MSTQAVEAVIGNPNMTRVFSTTATDGQYNNLTDSVTSTALGLTMPGQSISYVCATYAAGNAIWRIISSQTNQIYRQGFASQSGYVDPAACKIAPLVVAPDMLFQVYSLAVDSTAAESNALALVQTNRGVEAFVGTNVPDSTATELTALISGLGVGDLLFGATLMNVKVQVEDSGKLTGITLLDAASGTQYTGRGSTRLPSAGGTSGQYNGDFMFSVPLQKGWKLKTEQISA